MLIIIIIIIIIKITDNYIRQLTTGNSRLAQCYPLRIADDHIRWLSNGITD